MADLPKKPDWDLDNWEAKPAIGKNGSATEHYHNKVTRQVFYTKEEVLRYVIYKTNEAMGPDPPLFEKEFMNEEKTVYVDRPWENDPHHTMADYLQGRVGKCMGMTPPESSSATATDAVMTEKPEPKPKGKATGSSSSAAKGGKKKHLKRKKKSN